ncbi:MAG: hypothetical protein ABW140_13250, partial [Candidatus Sedimenticola sp. 6PFRAG1]
SESSGILPLATWVKVALIWIQCSVPSPFRHAEKLSVDPNKMVALAPGLTIQKLERVLRV